MPGVSNVYWYIQKHYICNVFLFFADIVSLYISSCYRKETEWRTTMAHSGLYLC